MKPIKYLTLVILLLTISHSIAAPNNLNTSLNDVLKSYFGIKNALVADDYKTANSEAKKFTAALKHVQVSQMDVKQRSVWAKYAEKLRFDGEHIGESTAVAHQREHFGNLSANMLAVVKAFHVNNMAVYQQYCPMVRKSWISESATIKNPYLGKTEPTCGVVKETFKASK
jgi:hypothetical protein